MPADTTTLTITESDITSLTINASELQDITAVTVQEADVTILISSDTTLVLDSLTLSSALPEDIVRSASAGISNTAARSDHRHSAANLLLDGGNY